MKGRCCFVLNQEFTSSCNGFSSTALEALDMKVTVVLSLLLSPSHIIMTNCCQFRLKGKALFKIDNHVLSKCNRGVKKKQSKAIKVYIVIYILPNSNIFTSCDASVIVCINFRTTNMELFWCYHIDIHTSASVG